MAKTDSIETPRAIVEVKCGDTTTPTVTREDHRMSADDPDPSRGAFHPMEVLASIVEALRAIKASDTHERNRRGHTRQGPGPDRMEAGVEIVESKARVTTRDWLRMTLVKLGAASTRTCEEERVEVVVEAQGLRDRGLNAL